MKDTYLGFSALIGTSLIYGIFGVIVRALEPYLTANQMTFSRASFLVIIFLFIFLYKKINVLKVDRKIILPLFIHSATFGVTIFLFTYAVLLTSLSKATFSFYSVSLMTSLFVSLLIFREKFSKIKGLSFGLATIGLICFTLPSGITSIDLGMILTAIAGVSDVISNSMKKYLGGKIDRMVLVFYQMLAGTIIGGVLVAISGEFTILKSFDLVGILWLAFFTLNFFLLSYFVSYGFQHFDLNLGTIILSLEFVWASLVGYFIYNEILTMYQVIACVLLIISIVVMNLPQKQTIVPDTTSTTY